MRVSRAAASWGGCYELRRTRFRSDLERAVVRAAWRARGLSDRSLESAPKIEARDRQRACRTSTSWSLAPALTVTTSGSTWSSTMDFESSSDRDLERNSRRIACGLNEPILARSKAGVSCASAITCRTAPSAGGVRYAAASVERCEKKRSVVYHVVVARTVSQLSSRPVDLRERW
jgi:hypothetical protein